MVTRLYTMQPSKATWRSCNCCWVLELTVMPETSSKPQPCMKQHMQGVRQWSRYCLLLERMLRPNARNTDHHSTLRLRKAM
mmetsp:Transcript_45576/g.71284  ORF Transcript_45576/g.71284 Transcript_45576/m.71284 type:complete len:81 (+) Transcript_45576:416-658(+)